ncbi:MAG: LPXTG cell wall anchor domain-containing protein [Acidimicrobiales bacterium]|nr:LPXTG cell wall anchor domain-containing protein [Acidimicrobiales bacterium]
MRADHSAVGPGYLTAAATATTVRRASTLPRTGTDMSAPALGGVVAILVGASLLAVAWKPRGAHYSFDRSPRSHACDCALRPLANKAHAKVPESGNALIDDPVQHALAVAASVHDALIGQPLELIRNGLLARADELRDL